LNTLMVRSEILAWLLKLGTLMAKSPVLSLELSEAIKILTDNQSG
jgi:hypothetical protein